MSLHQQAAAVRADHRSEERQRNHGGWQRLRTDAVEQFA